MLVCCKLFNSTASNPASTVVATFGSSNSFPVTISRTIVFQANTGYDVRVELMQTDLSSSSEYAVIYIDGRSNGNTEDQCNNDDQNCWKCDGGNVCDGCCNWHTCSDTITVTSTTTSASIKLVYTNHVSSTYATCTDPITGESGGGVARITLTPSGWFKLPRFLYCRNVYFVLYNRG